MRAPLGIVVANASRRSHRALLDRFFMHYAEGSLMPPLLVRLIFDRVRNAPLPFFVRPIARRIVEQVDAAYTQPEIDRHLAYVESCLAERPWLAGEQLSAADIQMSYPVEAALARSRAAPDALPALRAYRERLRQRPAYQRALEKGEEPT